MTELDGFWELSKISEIDLRLCFMALSVVFIEKHQINVETKC